MELQIAPEDLVVTFQGPGVEGQHPGALHRLAHQVARDHTPAQGRHAQDHDRRNPTQLRSGFAHGGQEQREARRGACRYESHRKESFEVIEKIDTEDQGTPGEHEDHLDHSNDGQIRPLSEQQLVHAQSTAEQSIEGGVFAFLEQRAAGCRGREKQEHHRNPGRIHRDDRVGFLASKNIDTLDRRKFGRWKRIARGCKGNRPYWAGGDLLALLFCKGRHDRFLNQSREDLPGDLIVGIREQLDCWEGALGRRRGEDDGSRDRAASD